MSIDLNRKQRFATKGIRFQRLNPDRTIPTPQRFLGFANTVDLSKALTNGKSKIIIKVDAKEKIEREVDFSTAVNLSAVTVQEAIAALTAANFPDFVWSQDEKTTRLKGSYVTEAGSAASITTLLHNDDTSTVTILEGSYSINVGEKILTAIVNSDTEILADDTLALVFNASENGVIAGLPDAGVVDISSEISPAIPTGVVATITSSTQGDDFTPGEGKIIQILSPLAGALDFGQCIKNGGLGLVVISFIDDEVINIGLPKDIKDKEEVDSEGANGDITRMIIGAMILGISPVVTMKVKDYNLLELIQGGNYDRLKNTYDPPLSGVSEHPSFWGEVFSPVFNAGTNDISSMRGYEILLLRSMQGLEGEIPIEAKSWAQYAFNLTAIEYVDEYEVKHPSWQEGVITNEEFDALKVKYIKVS